MSITVRVRLSGEMIFVYNGLTTVRPASNMKLLTTAAPISGLTTSQNTDYDSGPIIVEAVGTVVGDLPSITVTSHIGDLQIVNEAQTVEAGKINTVTIERRYQRCIGLNEG